MLQKNPLVYQITESIIRNITGDLVIYSWNIKSFLSIRLYIYLNLQKSKTVGMSTKMLQKAVAVKTDLEQRQVIKTL